MKRYISSFRISFFIFFCMLFGTQCRQREQQSSVSIVSKDDKAVGVVIRGVQLSESEIPSRLKVQLVKPGHRVPVLGDYKIHDSEIFFEPLVPFTRGLKYEILLDDSLMSEIAIPLGDATLPELLSIYPTQDTVPENLLKMYFEFSLPMVEGNSLDHITLIRSDGDTMNGTFLNLHPELWNAEGTVLTLWLDPGRIKRDLIPNRSLGTPLEAGNEYTLYVSENWRSKNGFLLSKGYSKNFVAARRDETSPDMDQWKIVAPAAGGKQPLKIIFPETLDYFLIRETLSILNPAGETLSGTTMIEDEEMVYSFIPDYSWTQGLYQVKAESRLEDLAGNNLNRPFDRVVTKNDNTDGQQFYTTEFRIP